MIIVVISLMPMRFTLPIEFWYFMIGFFLKNLQSMDQNPVEMTIIGIYYYKDGECNWCVVYRLCNPLHITRSRRVHPQHPFINGLKKNCGKRILRAITVMPEKTPPYWWISSSNSSDLGTVVHSLSERPNEWFRLLDQVESGTSDLAAEHKFENLIKYLD